MKINLNELFSAHDSTSQYVAAVMNVDFPNPSDAVYTTSSDDSSVTIEPVAAGYGTLIVTGDMMFADKVTHMSSEVIQGSMEMIVTISADLEITVGAATIPITVVPAPVAEPIAPVVEPVAPVIEPVVHEPVVAEPAPQTTI